MIFLNKNVDLFNGPLTLTNINTAVKSCNNIDIFHPMSFFIPLRNLVEAAVKKMSPFCRNKTVFNVFMYSSRVMLIDHRYILIIKMHIFTERSNNQSRSASCKYISILLEVIASHFI
jgi:hypothetical protein